MALDDALLLDLVGEIYEAAISPETWPRVLERISDALDGAAILTGVQRLPEGIPSATFARLDPDCFGLSNAITPPLRRTWPAPCNGTVSPQTRLSGHS